MHRLLLGAAVALSLATAAQAQRSGIYAVEGAQADGSRYTGTVQLSATGPTTWVATWRIGGDTTTGTGLLPANSGVLVVGYTSHREPGVSIMTVQPDGSLVGLWTSGRTGSVGPERWLPR